MLCHIHRASSLDMASAADTWARYTLKGKLRQGSYACIHVCRDRISKLKRAMKIVDLRRSNQASVREHVAVWSRASKHRNVLGLLSEFAGDQEHFFVMELCCSAVVDTLAVHKFQELHVFVALFHVISGLRHCHRNGIVHRDLKIEHLLVGSDGEVKIADFHVATFERRNLCGAVGTSPYMSPEMSQGFSYDCRTDIWSLGVISYVLLRLECYPPCASSPADKRQEKEMMEAMRRGVLEIKKACGDPVHDATNFACSFVCKLLEWELETRLFADQCMQLLVDGMPSVVQNHQIMHKNKQQVAFKERVCNDPAIKHLVNAWSFSQKKDLKPMVEESARPHLPNLLVGPGGSGKNQSGLSCV